MWMEADSREKQIFASIGFPASPSPNLSTKVVVLDGSNPAPSERDTSFFYVTKSSSIAKCEEHLRDILTTSPTKAEVCRQLSIWEGVYFNLNPRRNAKKAELVNQYWTPDLPFKRFTAEDFKKYWHYTSPHAKRV